MNRLMTVALLFSFVPLFVVASETFQLILEPRWDILEQDPQKAEQCGGNLILIAKITFKKKIADQITLQTISLHWHGESIDALSGSLYKKESEKAFRPIEKNVICDSSWNKEQQTLIFTFKHPEKLSIHREFWLVLTTPDALLEKKLKDGHFSIIEKCLPNAMQESAKNDALTIAFSDIDCKKIISIH